jgi:hypothetical protein
MPAHGMSSLIVSIGQAALRMASEISLNELHQTDAIGEKPPRQITDICTTRVTSFRRFYKLRHWFGQFHGRKRLRRRPRPARDIQIDNEHRPPLDAASGQSQKSRNARSAVVRLAISVN